MVYRAEQRVIISNGVKGSPRVNPLGSPGYGPGLEMEEPPIILGPEDETFMIENMIFSIGINTIVPEFGAIKIGKDIIIPPMLTTSGQWIEQPAIQLLFGSTYYR